jgi:hypothetical protein
MYEASMDGGPQMLGTMMLSLLGFDTLEHAGDGRGCGRRDFTDCCSHLGDSIGDGFGRNKMNGGRKESINVRLLRIEEEENGWLSRLPPMYFPHKDHFQILAALGSSNLSNTLCRICA